MAGLSLLFNWCLLVTLTVAAYQGPNGKKVNLMVTVYGADGQALEGVTVTALLPAWLGGSVQGTSNEEGDAWLSVPLPSQELEIYVQAANQDGTLFGRELHWLHPDLGDEDETGIELAAVEVLELTVTITGVDLQGRNFGSLSGVKLNTYDEVQLAYDLVTDHYGRATVRVVKKAGGSSNMIRVKSMPLEYMQVGSYSYTTETSLSVHVKLHKPCIAAWNRVSVRSLEHTAPDGPESFSLALFQKPERQATTGCTQRQWGDCMPSYVKKVSDAKPSQSTASFFPASTAKGYIYVEVSDVVGSGLAGPAGKGATVRFSGPHDVKQFTVQVPELPAFGRHKQAQKWSVGCVDMATGKLHCLNRMELGNKCEGVFE